MSWLFCFLTETNRITRRFFLPLTKPRCRTAQKSYRRSSARTASGCRVWKKDENGWKRVWRVVWYVNTRFGETSGNSPAIWYTSVGLIVSHYPLLSLWTPHVHLKRENSHCQHHLNEMQIWVWSSSSTDFMLGTEVFRLKYKWEPRAGLLVSWPKLRQRVGGFSYFSLRHV